MSFYPPKINERFRAPKNAGESASANAVGTGVSFVCGVFVRFYLSVDARTKRIKEAKYKTNACGFAVAAADVLAEMIAGAKLTELHGSEKQILQTRIASKLEKFPADRAHCLEICADALLRAFADFRRQQIEEFTGEKALICTCFGVAEETIEKVVAENQCETVEDVTEICRAGGGCGSCQFLIQEILDDVRRGRF